MSHEIKLIVIDTSPRFTMIGFDGDLLPWGAPVVWEEDVVVVVHLGLLA